ncbi:RES domain-containing protein [Pelomonas cellulosilytica]|uniref:RES family NAD+ phosphorylase n=1 Tax=Pelomonas cellulosilytica TaxID=2906762 RepID=A0ABS8XYM4_9BURK|nr:RES domain-containing protein [Pelomonas sp. P8]MCE4556927.1 RES family NAD+ phosphorylase [Pelomonas sp. P8]
MLVDQRLSVEIGKAVGAEGFEGIVYRSAQHHGQDCLVVFGAGLRSFKRVWRKALVLADDSMDQALATASRGGQIMLAP